MAVRWYAICNAADDPVSYATDEGQAIPEILEVGHTKREISRQPEAGEWFDKLAVTIKAIDQSGIPTALRVTVKERT